MRESPSGPGRTAIAGFAALAAAMGIGRFVYTPLLPVMTDQTVMTTSLGATVASANYLGYLIGAVALAARPARMSGRLIRVALLVLVACEFAMLVEIPTAWVLTRLVAGAASALVFVGAAQTATSLDHRGPGLVYAGVGGGIIGGGLLVWAMADADWRHLWIAAGVLGLALTAIAWPLRPPPHPPRSRPDADAAAPRRPPRSGRFALVGSYLLEGLGYIITGTFLVAAVGDPAIWILAGAACAPSAVFWSWFGRRFGNRRARTVAYMAQVAGAALPVLSDSAWATASAAVLFGGTFIGISLLTLGRAASMGIPASAAILTSAYGVGQILGPLLVAPFLGDGWRVAFIVATTVTAAAAVLSAAVPDHRPRAVTRGGEEPGIEAPDIEAPDTESPATR